MKRFEVEPESYRKGNGRLQGDAHGYELSPATHGGNGSYEQGNRGSRLDVRMATRLGQVVCGLHGHDAVLHFEGSRVMMRCTSCGHDTPGWEITR